MFCPVCGQPGEADGRFCCHCGAALTPPPKKGRLWPAALALLAIFSIGLGVFLLNRPQVNMVTDPAAPWFSLLDGELYFHEYAYRGSGVLTVPDTIGGQPVTAIGGSCFYDCDSLTAIHLPGTVTHIGPEAFSGCDALRAVELPESLLRLDSEAFFDCISLESVCIPDSLRHLGDELFSGCQSLSCIFYSGTLEEWKALGLYGIPKGTVLSCADGIYTMN